MSRDLKHQSLEDTFEKVAELDFGDDEYDIPNEKIFPTAEDFNDTDSENSVDLGLSDDVEQSNFTMRCVLELGDVVRELLGWKDRMLVLYPLPTEVQLHLVLPLSKLTRLKDMLLPSVRNLQRIAKIFASGQVGDELIKHMRSVLAANQAELAMQKLRREETERKLDAVVHENSLLQRLIHLIHWMKMFTKLRRREILRANKHKVTHLQHVIGSLRRKFHRADAEVKALKNELESTRIEAQVLIRQAHQSARFMRADGEAPGEHGDHAEEPQLTVRNVTSKSGSPSSDRAARNEIRSISALSNLSDEQYVFLDDLEEHGEGRAPGDPLEKFLLEERDVPITPKGKRKSQGSRKQRRQSKAQSKAQRKTQNKTKPRDMVGEQLQLAVAEVDKHFGDAGVTKITPEDAFTIYKRARKEAELKEENERRAAQGLPPVDEEVKEDKESAWHKKYFRRIDSNGEDSAEGKNKLDTTDVATEVSATSSAGAESAVDQEETDKEQGQGPNVDDGLGKDESFTVDAAQGRLESSGQSKSSAEYEAQINRLENIIQGLERQLLQEIKEKEELKRKQSVNRKKNKFAFRTRRPPSGGRQIVDPNYVAESTTPQPEFDAPFKESQIRPWTANSGTEEAPRKSKRGLELPAEFMPIGMPKNQAYNQRRFKAVPSHGGKATAKYLNFSDRIMPSNLKPPKSTQRPTTSSMLLRSKNREKSLRGPPSRGRNVNSDGRSMYNFIM